MMKNHNFISNLLNFNESPAPRKKIIEVGTAVRTPQNKKESKKSSKGLRTLSESVYEIVLELKVTTYKEVANRLVQNLNESGIRREDHYRDEQNIKRRVYDALNVLISASVLQKKGKEVMTDNTAIPQKMRVRENLM